MGRSLENASDDSDVSGEDVAELLLCVVATLGVIVSARVRGTKRPYSRGWFFQASVENVWVFKCKRARCDHDAA